MIWGDIERNTLITITIRSPTGDKRQFTVEVPTLALLQGGEVELARVAQDAVRPVAAMAGLV